jgi:hypothetical protein
MFTFVEKETRRSFGSAQSFWLGIGDSVRVSSMKFGRIIVGNEAFIIEAWNEHCGTDSAED